MYSYCGERQRLDLGIFSWIKKKKNGSVFLSVFMSETQKLHLRKIELNSHSFSEHVLVRSLNSFNVEKMHTFVNSADRQVAPCGGDGN